MTVNSELKLWLERPNPLDSLKLAIKVWNSVEFMYTSKYDVIVEHFSQLVCQTIPTDVDKDEFLSTVKEFVSLQYPVGVVSQASKKILLNAVLTMDIQGTDSRVYADILRCLQLHTRMANFYNSNQDLYGKVVSRLFDQHLVLLDITGFVSAAHVVEIKQHLSDVKTFCQYNLSVPSIDAIFANHFMQSLSNVVIKCQSSDYPISVEYFAILEMIYFNAEKTQKWRDYLKSYPEGEIDFFKMFPQDHVLLLLLDALVANYQNDKEMMNLLIHCILEKLPKDYSKYEIQIIRHVFYLLRKYEIKVVLSKTHEMISTLVMNMVAKAAQSYPVLVLDLICQAIQWNPIVQDEVLMIIVHFMTVDKDQATLNKYAELVRRVMSTFSRLNRFEKKTSKLFELVKVETEKLKVTSKLKRKQGSVTGSAKKKKKGNDSLAMEVPDEAVNLYLSLIEGSYNSEKDVTESSWDDSWQNLTNIWPRSVSQLWGQSVSGLVTKPSLILWKSLLITLTEALSNSAMKSYDEQTVLYVKFVSCFMVEYLASTRLLEHTDQQYEVIEEMCGQTKAVLKAFGAQILETEHNTELMSAFLSVAIKAGEFESSLLYYHPDSIGDEKEDAENTKLRKMDFQQKIREVFNFLSVDEWSLIEQRVINFGKENCRSRLNDLNFRKIKAIQLYDPAFVSRDAKNWNKAIIGDYKLLTKFTESCLYSDEFVADMTRKQKITLVKTIVESDQEDGTEQICKFIGKISEQYEMVELIAFVLLKVIAEKSLPEDAALRKVDFNSLLQNQEISLPQIDELLAVKKKKKCEIVDEEELMSKLKLIHSLPLGYLKEREKENLYPILVLLCHDLSGHEELRDAVLNNIRLMRELGHRFDSLKHLDLTNQLNIFTTTSGRSLLMDSIGNFFGDSQLKQVKALLKKMGKEEGEHSELILLMTERFSLAKQNHKNEKTLSIYKMKLTKLVFQIYEREFASRKAGGLLFALDMYLNNKENLTEANGELGKLCMKVVSEETEDEDEMNEVQKAQILTYCFQHKTHLELKLEDLEEVLDRYWTKIKAIQDPDLISVKSKLTIMGLFNGHASTERYMALLTEIAEMAENEKEIGNLRIMCKHLQNLCPLAITNAKGTALSEYLKKTLDIIILKLTLRDGNIYDHAELILDILKCFSVAALNRQIVMSQSLFANILSFSLDLNIKRFKVTETNANTFTRIHEQLSQMCTNLIQARSLALAHAMPQLVSLLKDLIHTVCAFRNGNNDAKQKLSEEEVSMLSNLAHRLEPILKGFADKDHLGRKVAPYLLVYVINEMIFNPNSTTLYPAIKLAINNVCYKLIAICDIKYNQFILRSCSEASGDVYKTLLKEYEQYYKFHGKV